MTVLKEYRINNNIKQVDMAEKLHCSIASYQLYENGKKTIPNRILLTFLKIRGTESDLRLAEILEELYEK